MTEWLVLGAHGFLGSSTGRYFTAERPGSQEVRMHGLTRAPCPLNENFAEHVIADMARPGQVAEIVRSLRPDVVLNASAMADHEQCAEHPETAMRVNALAPAEVAEACRVVGAHFVHVSTDAVFDGRSGGYRESHDPTPFSLYGETKAEGERLVLAANPDALVVRTNFFGWSPSGTRSILEFFFTNLSSGRPVLGYTDFVVSTGFVLDVLGAIADLIELRASGIVHVTSRDALSKYEFGCLVAELFDLDDALITPTDAESGGRGNRGNRNLSLSNSLVESLLERPMASQREGLDRALVDRNARL